MTYHHPHGLRGRRSPRGNGRVAETDLKTSHRSHPSGRWLVVTHAVPVSTGNFSLLKLLVHSFDSSRRRVNRNGPSPASADISPVTVSSLLPQVISLGNGSSLRDCQPLGQCDVTISDQVSSSLPPSCLTVSHGQLTGLTGCLSGGDTVFCLSSRVQNSFPSQVRLPLGKFLSSFFPPHVK